jgi:SOS-response transcriptional repressor LexA
VYKRPYVQTDTDRLRADGSASRKSSRFISECVATDGLPPTRAEIARALGFSSPNAAEQHVKALVNKGALEWVPARPAGCAWSASKSRGCR